MIMSQLYKMTSIFILAFVLIAVSSCDEYLDKAPMANLNEETVFTNYENAERFHSDIYSNLQSRFNAIGNEEPVPMASASDEADSPQGYHGSTRLNVGVYEGMDANIDNLYTGIRKINIFLSKADIIPFPSETRKDRMLGEAYFLRAFYFNEVVKRFGGMPIMNEKNILFPNDDMFLPRNTYKECVTFILADLERAISLLPVTLEETDYGRATKGAAMALKARVLLFAASPLWQNEMKENLWTQAAEAAKAVINLRDNNGELVYELYNTGKFADDYEQLFFVRREGGNKEIIFHKHAGPVGFETSEIKVWAPKGGNLGGNGAVCPTQNFVNLFEMNNGMKITDEGSGYDPQNPYKNRDPRFYKTVLYHGAEWQGEVMDLSYNEVKDLSGKHRLTKSEFTRTGYYVRKYLPQSVKYQTTNRSYHNWIFFRLAEMYLNYAEAMNESLSQPNAEVYNDINIIRNRSGMPNLPAGLTKEQMRERIWNERAIELSFEEHRWWDARRWLKAVEWFGTTMYEMEIKRTGSGFLYTEKPFFTRIFRSYMNLYPIPTTEMNKNPLFTQNPGW